MRRRIFPQAALAVVLLIVAPAAVVANTPVSGAHRLYSNDNKNLDWDFAGSYKSWLKAPVKEALDTNYDDPATNNSKTAHFAYTSPGDGDVFYSGAASSPCSTGNLAWIQCANGGGTNTFNIYVRNFDSSPLGHVTWYDIDGSCGSNQTCYDLRRVVIYESIHVTMGVTNHDEQGESITVMSTYGRKYPLSGWNQTHMRKCDEAAAQLLYGVRAYDGPYANCFEEIAGHGIDGLKTIASSTYSSYTACIGFNSSTSGRLAVKDASNSNYGELADNPLQGRTLWFDRKPSSSSTWTNNVHSTVATASGSSNWSRSIPNPGSGVGTWDYRIQMSAENGLDASTQPTFTITWTNSPTVCA